MSELKPVTFTWLVENYYESINVLLFKYFRPMPTSAEVTLLPMLFLELSLGREEGSSSIVQEESTDILEESNLLEQARHTPDS